MCDCTTCLVCVYSHPPTHPLTVTAAPGSAMPFKNDRAPYSLLVCKTILSANHAGSFSVASAGEEARPTASRNNLDAIFAAIVVSNDLGARNNVCCRVIFFLIDKQVSGDATAEHLLEYDVSTHVRTHARVSGKGNVHVRMSSQGKVNQVQHTILIVLELLKFWSKVML